MKHFKSILRKLIMVAIVAMTTALTAQGQDYVGKVQFPEMIHLYTPSQQTATAPNGATVLVGASKVDTTIWNGVTYTWSALALVASPSGGQDWGFAVPQTMTNYAKFTAATYDDSGNLYIAMEFVDSVVVSSNVYYATGLQDVLVFKLSSSGVLLNTWHLQVSTKMRVYDMHVRPTGELDIVGWMKGSLSIDGVSTGASSPSSGIDGFILGISSTGTYSWSQMIGDASDNDADCVQQIVGTPAGGILVSGYFEGAVPFGAGTNNTKTSMGYSDYFIVEYSSFNVCLRSWQIGSPGILEHYSELSLDGDNITILVAMQSMNTKINNSDNTIGATLSTGYGSGDNMLIAKFSRTTGNYLSNYFIPCQGWAKVGGIVQKNGNTYSTIEVSGNDTLYVDYANNQYIVGGGVVILKLDSNCDFVWAHDYGSGTPIDLFCKGDTLIVSMTTDTADADIDPANTVICTAGDVVISYFIGIPAPSISVINAIICAGDSTEVKVDSVDTSLTYDWFKDGVDMNVTDTSIYVGIAGTYTCVASSGGQTSVVSNSVVVTVNTIPGNTGSAAGNSNPNYNDSEVYTVTNLAGATYTWILPNTWSGSSTTNSITTTVGSTDGNIIVTASNACGVSPADTLAVTVVIPVLTTTTTPDGEICATLSKTLSATPSGGIGNYSYQWTSNPVGFNSTLATVSVTPTLPTTYYVTVTSGNQSATDTVIVIVNVNPTAEFGADSVNSVGGIVNFSDSSVAYNGASIVGWDWDFGDGNTSSQQNPTHAYANGGTYDAEETVMDSKGCHSSLTKLNYISTSVGIEDIEGFSFSIYPNPTSDIINIESSKQIQEVKLFNSAGQLIRVTNENLLNVQDLVPGAYILHIILENGSVSTAKIVKR